MDTKVCTRCNETFPKDKFTNGKCKPCYNLTQRERHKFRAANDPAYRVRLNLQAKKDRERNPRSYERRKGEWLKYKYKMTLEDYDKMLFSQNGVCAICKEKCKTGRGLAIDHDHSCCPADISCGKCIRGLLCSGCNRAIGFFKEDINIFSNAIKYLTSS